MFRNNPIGFIVAVILIPVGVGAVILIYWYLKAHATRMTISGNALHISRGLFSKENIDIDARKIRTVTVKQSFWQRIFDVGMIEIFTGGDDAECTLMGMPYPNKVRELVKSRALDPDRAER
ncbi:MAG: PH domain-containing protein [Rhodobacteraceae bacterium]|nr:PH domain-containing protein [Paracoccaceae bacterium]